MANSTAGTKRGQGALAAASLCGALALLGCAEKPLFWTRTGSGEAEYERTSRACTEQGERQAALEQQSQPAPGLGGSTGSGYGTPDRRTAPGTENDRRRQERRIRYYYGECMEARGWTSNTSGEGFPGR
jgi:hypothetical protein